MIDTTGATSGQVLTYDGSAWKSASPSSVPTGCVMMWSTSAVPTGWIECNGQSTASYPALAAVVGANVPDLRGEFIRGWDHEKGTDSGRTLGSSQSGAIESHTHNAQTGNLAGAQFAQGNLGYPREYGGYTATTATGGTETRPRNVALMYIIKT